jgi:hypothetical protein
MTSAPESVRNSVHITRAAQWLADQPHNPAAVIPALRGQFDLSIDDAHEAVVLAGRMRMLREAFA